MSRTHLYSLITISLIALLLRAGLHSATVIPMEEIISGDAPGYLARAESLYKGHGFTIEVDGVHKPDTVRTPVYPLFLASIKTMVGLSPATVFTMQSLLVVMVIIATFLLTTRLASPRAGMIAAGIVAVAPSLIHASLLVMTEVLFMTFTMLGVYSLFRWKAKSMYLWLVLSAIAFTLATLTRPISLFIPIIVLPYIFIVNQESTKKALMHSLVWLVIYTLPIAGWVARNAIVADMAGLTNISAINMYEYRAAGVVSKLEGIPFQEARTKLIQQMADETRGFSTAARLEYMNTKGVEIITSHPLTYAWVHTEGILRLLFGRAVPFIAWRMDIPIEGLGILTALEKGNYSELTARLFSRNALSVVAGFMEVGILLVLYFLTIFSVIQMKNDNQSLYLLILALIFYFLVLSGGPEAGARFRAPLIPLIAITSAVGFERISAKF